MRRSWPRPCHGHDLPIGTCFSLVLATSLQVSYGFVLQVPAMGAQTLSWPCPSHWYSQSSLYSVTHSVSVYGSYSVLYCSTHTFLYTVLHCFSYTVLHSCLVVGWHSLCVSVLHTSVSVSLYSVSQRVAYSVLHCTDPVRGAVFTGREGCTPPYWGAPTDRLARRVVDSRIRIIVVLIISR